MSSAPDSIPASPVVRPSACPGLVRVVAAADGGLCRIKLPGGRLDARQARAIAAAARRYGSGAIDATNRANLQLRGIRDGAADALTHALLEAGLGPRANADDTAAEAAALAASDDVRNVLLSPLAGHDPTALVDSHALAVPLLDMLANEPRRGELSPKFSIQLDGGEAVAALDHPHDIWLAAWRRADGAVRLAAGLAGCPPVAPGDRPASVDVSPDQGVALVRALLRAFLDLAPADVTRMRALLATCSERTLFERARRYLPFPLAADPALAGWRRTHADPALRFGAQPSRDAARCSVGAQFALGRLDTAQLERLAALAEADGDGTLSMTPWQGVFMHGVPNERAVAMREALKSLGLVGAASEPLAALVACTGSAGCAKAHADTKHDALALAARIGRPLDVHLTGCARHCALPHPATHTLVAVAPAHYDLYRRDAAAGLGAPLARHLTIDQAAVRLMDARHSQDTTDA
ncbi:UNVERIFIED_ORG: precorrin-3B synthase [Burkholderia cepacia]|nr:precorrin-3B synthase [Burkholderia cenocepacia]MDP9544053.1 precorrin-3B synthase [Burkholderia cepacia]MDP9594044.1 precorrin-3B synthase [Burkholderia cepacia]MDP9621642.1 precorrin-3B synthase [Burkholderia cepacia]MDP9667706.1 precorrin-3B synthase [Burkholderia cepacia]MDP9715307.1 precorrin-3B synthase [Burkholderia cepacia]